MNMTLKNVVCFFLFIHVTSIISMHDNTFVIIKRDSSVLQKACIDQSSAEDFKHKIDHFSYMLSEVDRHNNTLFHSVKDIEKATILSQKYIAPLINCQNDLGDTPLHKAAALATPQIAALYLSIGASPCKQNSNKQTPLHVATSNNNIDMVKLLLSHNNTFDQADKEGMTCLMRASLLGYQDIVEVLIASKKTDINAINKYGHSALHFTKKAGIVKMLCEAGLDINRPGKYGHTPIRLACLDGIETQDLQAFIDHGANPYEVDNDGNSLLHCVRHKSLGQFLIDNFINVNLQNKAGDTPLHKAAKLKNPDLALYLIAAGADIHKTNNNKETPLHCAYTVPTALVLLSSGVQVDALDIEQNTPIQSILYHTGPVIWGDLMQLFLDFHTNVYHKNDIGNDTITIAFDQSIDSAIVLSDEINVASSKLYKYESLCFDKYGNILENKMRALIKMTKNAYAELQFEMDDVSV